MDMWARRKATYIVATLQEWHHGREFWNNWLWGTTPFPAWEPRWEELVFGFSLSLLPTRIAKRLLGMKMYQVDIDMGKALERAGRRAHE